MALLVSIDTIFPRSRRPRASATLRRRLSGERGFTLVELLVAMALAAVVFGAILSMLESSQRVEARDTEWALTMQEGRSGLSRMSREIRQASKIEKAETGTIDFLATVGSTEYHVRYECGVVESAPRYKCVRFASKIGESLPATGTRVVGGVLNGTTVFKYFKKGFANTTEPNYVTLTLELPASGTLKQAGSSAYKQHVVLTDTAYMRNLNLEG
jgi:prepilin-type N-terminal cleavage/methylation domain-containing protein